MTGEGVIGKYPYASVRYFSGKNEINVCGNVIVSSVKFISIYTDGRILTLPFSKVVSIEQNSEPCDSID